MVVDPEFPEKLARPLVHGQIASVLDVLLREFDRCHLAEDTLKIQSVKRRNSGRALTVFRTVTNRGSIRAGLPNIQ